MDSYGFKIDLWSDNGILHTFDAKTAELYDRWQKSGLDSDFEILAQWVIEDVASELQFNLVNLEKVED